MGISRLRAANSRTALTCSRVTGNCSITSSMVMPSSKFSNTMATGVRVDVNTHAPLTLPGMRSTPGHWDQSREGITEPPYIIQFTVSAPDGHTGVSQHSQAGQSLQEL